MIDLQNLLVKLSGLTLESRLLEPSPYQRFKSIADDEIFNTWRSLKSPQDIKPDAVKLLFCVTYSNEIVGMNTFIEEVTDERDKEVAEIVDRAWAENYAPNIGDLKAIVKLMGRKVSNADRYPGAEWLDVVRPIGSVGGSTMFLVGQEVPTSNEYPLVAVDRGGSLWATPLWELQAHSQDKIEITEEF